MLVYLKQNYPNGNNVYANSVVAKKALDFSMMRKFENVNLCIVSQGTGYVDLPIESALETEQYTGGVYSVKDNSTGWKNFYAFKVDRYEPNNMEEDDKQYWRFYFTVDWWTTYLLWDNNFRNKINGTVNRAHVNDLELEGSGFSPVRTLDNAYPESEVDVPYFEKDGKALGERLYLYITTTKPYFESGSLTSAESIGLPDKPYVAGYFYYCFPLFAGVFKCHCIDQYGTTEDIDCSSLTGILSPELITDQSVFAMTISNLPPASERIVDGVYHYDFVIRQLSAQPQVFGEQNKTKIEFRSSGGLGILPQTPIPVSDITIFNIKANKDKKIGQVLTAETYEEYLEKGITKAHFYPYNFRVIEKSNRKCLIDEVHCEYTSANEPIGKITFATPFMSYGIEIKSKLRKGEEVYDIIQDDGNFPISQANDYFTRLNVFASGMNSLGDLAKAIGDSGFKALPTITKGVSTANVLQQGYKTLRDGEHGTKVSPNVMTNLYDPIRITSVKPNENCKTALLENLALYGYLTPLQLNDILLNHARTHFNFIHANDVHISSNISMQAKEQITNMFKSGVFLWQDETFNVKVANYPQTVVRYSLEIGTYKFNDTLTTPEDSLIIPINCYLPSDIEQVKCKMLRVVGGRVEAYIKYSYETEYLWSNIYNNGRWNVDYEPYKELIVTQLTGLDKEQFDWLEENTTKL